MMLTAARMAPSAVFSVLRLPRLFQDVLNHAIEPLRPVHCGPHISGTESARAISRPRAPSPNPSRDARPRAVVAKMRLSRFVSLCPANECLQAVPGRSPGASCVRKLYTSLAFSYPPPNQNNGDRQEPEHERQGRDESDTPGPRRRCGLCRPIVGRIGPRLPRTRCFSTCDPRPGAPGQFRPAERWLRSGQVRGIHSLPRRY